MRVSGEQDAIRLATNPRKREVSARDRGDANDRGTPSPVGAYVAPAHWSLAFWKICCLPVDDHHWLALGTTLMDDAQVLGGRLPRATATSRSRWTSTSAGCCACGVISRPEAKGSTCTGAPPSATAEHRFPRRWVALMALELTEAEEWNDPEAPLGTIPKTSLANAVCGLCGQPAGSGH